MTERIRKLGPNPLKLSDNGQGKALETEDDYSTIGEEVGFRGRTL
jgi:hypothetical protein